MAIKVVIKVFSVQVAIKVAIQFTCDYNKIIVETRTTNEIAKQVS